MPEPQLIRRVPPGTPSTRAGAALVLVVSLLPATAHGQARPEPQRPDALSLTVSGGVSLGAYQAGYLYFAIETTRRHVERPPLRLVTGASAGSINTLTAVLAACQPSGTDPDQSLFWRSWVDLGFHELFDP